MLPDVPIALHVDHQTTNFQLVAETLNFSDEKDNLGKHLMANSSASVSTVFSPAAEEHPVLTSTCAHCVDSCLMGHRYVLLNNIFPLSTFLIADR